MDFLEPRRDGFGQLVAAAIDGFGDIGNAPVDRFDRLGGAVGHEEVRWVRRESIDWIALRAIGQLRRQRAKAAVDGSVTDFARDRTSLQAI